LLSSLLSAYPAKSASCWLCSFSDLPHLSSIAVPTVNCSSASVVKQAMSQIVNTIQNFCNSNSSNPPITWIGVIGGDRLVGQILRAYVECLHHKSSSHWLHYLRFAIIPAPHSLVAKLLEGHDAVLDQLCRDMWERWTELSPVEKLANTEKMNAWLTAGGGACLNLPIGEALLQLADACRVFVPFLAEVRVGQSSEDEDSPYTFSSPRGKIILINLALSGSPPNSPQVRTDAHEIDPSNVSLVNVNSMPSQNVTPNSKKDLSKGSMKATFRTLVITRSCNQHLLSLNFVKEKRKEKMLQKLGMKKGQVSRSENENPPVQVTAVSRLLCSGASKHTDLTVSVDGSTYQRVRYFQCSSQWQTHIKSFPVSLISQGVGPIGL
uniref:Phosphofurin acidic cluster sorting protein 2 n=1 Tax=Haemonchus placei TaxID=6290 RepID=A0A0N4WH93_HAEPC